MKSEREGQQCDSLGDRLNVLQAELEELLRNERAFRELAEHIPEVFWMTNAEVTELVYVSPAYEYIWGQTCESLYADPTSRLHWVHPDDRDRVVDAFRTQATAGTYDIQFRIKRPDGEIRWIRDRAYPVFDDEGQVYRLAGFALDVTRQQQDRDDTQRLQMRMAQFDRLSAVGALGSALAHEISQPLTAARSYLSQGMSLLNGNGVADSNRRLAALMSQSDGEIERAGGVVSHLRDFVRYGQPRCESQDLRTLVNDVLALVAPRLRSERTFTDLDLDDETLEVWVDPVFLQQILLNLIGNALDAMAGESAGDRRVSLQSEVTDGLVRLRVSDTGGGIASEAQDRLFDPFYTSKSDGIGLGLAVSRSLAEAHGGRLDLDHSTDAGATFVLTLPAFSND